MGTDKLYLAKGKMQVTARGYWFTSGGEKGPFGFYPHLKDENGCPVFPDTQIHGDLKMAALWLAELDTGFDVPFAERIFGKKFKDGSGIESALLRIKNFKDGNGIESALLRIADLELKDFKGNAEKLFEIKPRIRIDNAKGTVQEKMLVDREVSFLENQKFESQIYLGYFRDEKELENAKKLVEECAKFLSGFGGFRSRGYGRGDTVITWEQTEQIEFSPDSDAQPELPCMLKALVHFRNKTVNPGVTQQLASLYSINSDQLRAWFAKTYFGIFGDWPTFTEIASVTFPTLYPCDGNSPAWPAAMSTLKNEKGKVQDLRDKNDTNQKIEEGEENFFSTKTKGLGSGYFVTNEPAVNAKVKTEYRIRNSINESFATVENGLFVQEFVKKGTCFSGIIRFADPGSAFAQKARFILKNVKPIIKGAMFERLDTEFKSADSPANAKSFLVTESISFKKSFFSEKSEKNGNESADSTDTDQSDQILLDSVRSFNTMLGRPRRNRIVIAPSSVLGKAEEDRTVAWAGFGFQGYIPLKEINKDDRKTDADASRKRVKSKLGKGGEWKDEKPVITRSQAGLLREYLHPGQSKEQILQNLNDRIEKYGAKSQDSVKALLTEIRKKLESENGMKDMKAFIEEYLEELGIYLFKNPNAGE